MDDNNDLVEYTARQLEQGIPEYSIRTTLAQNSWPQDLIDQAFKSVEQRKASIILPMPQADEPVARQDFRRRASPSPPPPNIDTFPMPQEDERNGSQARWIRAIVTLIISLALVVLAFIGLRALLQQSTPSNQQQSSDTDLQRKRDLDSIAKNLATYYDSHKTYPSLAELNNPGFVAIEKGFDASGYRDPSWKDTDSACTGNDTKPKLVSVRTVGCYAYRTTGISGDECDARKVKCERVVLTANLTAGEPYIVILEQNNREVYEAK